MKKLIIFTAISLLAVLIINPESYPQAGVKNAFSVLDSVQGTYQSLQTVSGFQTASSFNYFFTGDIIADDTVEISTSTAFTKKIIVLPGILFPLPMFGTSTVSDLYIRRFRRTGETGYPKYLLRVWGF